MTEDGERAEDLVEDEDWATLAVFADTKEQLEQEKLRRLSAVAVVEGRGQEARREPAWVRRMSLQEARKEVGGAGAGQEKETADTRRKGSAWVGKEEIVEEEESDDTPDQEEVVVPPAKPPRVAAPPASVPPRSLATTTIIVSKERDTEAATPTARSQPRQRRRGRLEGEGVGSQFLSVSADKVKTPPSRPSNLASKPSTPSSTSASKPSTPSISVSTPSSTSTSSLTPVTSGAVAAAKQRFIVAASAGTETVAVKVSENVSSSSSSSVTAASASSSTSSSSSAKFGKIKFSETSDKISTTACVTGTTKER